MRQASLTPALGHEASISFRQFVAIYHQLTTVQRSDGGAVMTISGQHPELGVVLILQSLNGVTLKSENPYPAPACASPPAALRGVPERKGEPHSTPPG